MIHQVSKPRSLGGRLRGVWATSWLAWVSSCPTAAPGHPRSKVMIVIITSFFIQTGKQTLSFTFSFPRTRPYSQGDTSLLINIYVNFYFNMEIINSHVHYKMRSFVSYGRVHDTVLFISLKGHKRSATPLAFHIPTCA